MKYPGMRAADTRKFGYKTGRGDCMGSDRFGEFRDFGNCDIRTCDVHEKTINQRADYLDLEASIGHEGLPYRKRGRSQEDNGCSLVLRVSQRVGRLNAINDHAFARYMRVELIAMQASFDHEVWYLSARLNPYGCGSTEGWWLNQAHCV